MSAQFEVPILFCVFNQPEVTARTFAAIRRQKPKRLFISADGPRANKVGEKEECEQTRKISQSVDWPCDVQLRLSDVNLGCKEAISGAVSWFYSQVSEGIILEYDCLPSDDFFVFCAEMLNRYRNDQRVLSITGDNFHQGQRWGDGDYYFSLISGVWGWATWSDRWKSWDGNLSSFSQFKAEKTLESYFKKFAARQFWYDVFESVYKKENKTTWAYAWDYAHLSSGRVCVTPNYNLVSNIGFTQAATHATDTGNWMANLPIEPHTVWKSPTQSMPCREADEIFTLRFVNSTVLRSVKRWLKLKIKSGLEKTLS